MARGLRLFFLGLGGLLVLVTLAGCGRQWFAQRDAWRHEAEVACLKSGLVKESPVLVRMEPIQGPGVCGADFPLKVAAFAGGSNAIGFADELRPPGSIPGVPETQQKWPVEPRPRATIETRPSAGLPARAAVSGSAAPPGQPLSINPPGLVPSGAAIGTYDRSLARAPIATAPAKPSGRRPSVFDTPSAGADADDDEDDEFAAPKKGAPARPLTSAPIVPLRRAPAYTGTIGPVEVKPTATLACPIVSALDQWLATTVQPASLRWFGQPVAEIKQISAYSCRGMNGDSRAHISEHAFGNALDISAFTLADGRVVTVRQGWQGRPEEQGFLRDIQGGACSQFNTVLAPGSNRFHYDHIHVDLMRRPSGRVVCEPATVSGEVVAARAAQKAYARGGDPGITGSVGTAGKTKKIKTPSGKWVPLDEDDEDVMESVDRENEPKGGPGED